MSAEKKSSVLEVTKALVLALVFTLALILVFALIIQWCNVPSGWITPVNQVIKVLSILSGTMVAARKIKGWLAGLIVGAAYMLLGVILYCAFSGELLPAAAVLGDAALGCAAGLLSGMLAGTLKR